MTFPCEKYGRIHLGVNCLDCALAGLVEQRVTERHNAEHEDDRLAAFQNGYDAATVKERQRSVLLIADAYGKALDAARAAVAAQGIVTANLIRLDAALAAIDALKGEQT